MALTVNTNVASLNVQKNLGHASDALSNSMTRLNSGLKINSAQDDAAALAIANRLNSQTSKGAQQHRYVNDRISLVQTGEGALTETSSMLGRMKDLATQSINQTSSDADRSAMQSEFADLTKEITRIGNDTSFNGLSILKSSYEIETQSAALFDESRSIKLNDMRSEALGVSDLSISTAEGGKEAISKIDEAIKMVNEQRAAFGKEQNHLEHQFSMRNNNEASVLGRVQDTDFAAEITNLTRGQMLQQAGTTMLSQANSRPQMVLHLLRG